MNILPIRSDAVYQRIVHAPPQKKDDIYRYALMAPFEKKWACYHVPIKAQKPGGYDVIIASRMLGYLAPSAVCDAQQEAIRLLGDDALWHACTQAIERSLACFTALGIALPVQEYQYTLLLADSSSPYVSASDGYCGDGGIPGYIFAALVPSAHTLSRMPAALAHEVNHNVRFQFIRWRDDITLGEMIVSEGLAENFATSLYGEEMAGPWVTKTDADTLALIKPVIREALGVQGLAALNAYLYGDELAAAQGYPPAGLPYCAGYACGYRLVKHFLAKTGLSIARATLLPAEDILKDAEDFWHEG